MLKLTEKIINDKLADLERKVTSRASWRPWKSGLSNTVISLVKE